MHTEIMHKKMLQGMRALRIANQNAFLPACKEFDLTFQQFTVLMELAHSPGLTAGELSDHTCILRTNFAAVANKLGKRGLIRYEKSTSDRRYNVIRLTDAGAQLTEDITRWLESRYGCVFDGEPEEVFDVIFRGFEAMERIALKLEHINMESSMKTLTEK